MSSSVPGPSAAQDRADARAARLTLMSRGRRVAAAANQDALTAARDDLVQYCSTTLLSHLQDDDR